MPPVVKTGVATDGMSAGNVEMEPSGCGSSWWGDRGGGWREGATMGWNSRLEGGIQEEDDDGEN